MFRRSRFNSRCPHGSTRESVETDKSTRLFVPEREAQACEAVAQRDPTNLVQLGVVGQTLVKAIVGNRRRRDGGFDDRNDDTLSLLRRFCGAMVFGRDVKRILVLRGSSRLVAQDRGQIMADQENPCDS